MENEEHNSRVIYDLLELAVGAQSRADYAQLQVNDIVGTAVREGATWEQVGRWLHLAPDILSLFPKPSQMGGNL